MHWVGRLALAHQRPVCITGLGEYDVLPQADHEYRRGTGEVESLKLVLLIECISCHGDSGTAPRGSLASRRGHRRGNDV
jgi:mono/diheme cytochrome c family protein